MNDEAKKQQELTQAREQLEKLKNDKAIKVAEALETLQSTPEWKLVIEDFLLKDEVIRYTMLKGDSNAEPLRNSIDESLIMLYTLSATISAIPARANKVNVDIEKYETFIANMA